jgi:acyl carrier protein
MHDKAELTELVAETARMICAEQPDMPEPHSLKDLDSFSFVQVTLELENSLNIKILEKLENFRGEQFEDLAAFLIECRQAAEAPDETTTRA